MEGVAAETGFFERVYAVATSPIDMIEGGLWGLWLGFQVSQLHTNIEAKREAEALPDLDPQKVDKVWNAKKAVFTKSTMTISAGAFVADWLGQVGILHFGPLQSLVAGLGYLGTAVCSPIFLWDTLKEINQGTIDYQNATSTVEKQEIGLRQFDRFLNVAMLVCFIGWGVLGFAHAFIGGASLFNAVDSCFLYGGILFLVRLGYVFLLLPSKRQEPVAS